MHVISIYKRAYAANQGRSQWQFTEICSYHLNDVHRLQDRLQRVLTPRAPLAVAYAWLLCRTGLDRERYYFGSAIGASGLCFALQVREKAVSVLPSALRCRLVLCAASASRWSLCNQQVVFCRSRDGACAFKQAFLLPLSVLVSLPK